MTDGKGEQYIFGLWVLVRLRHAVAIQQVRFRGRPEQEVIPDAVFTYVPWWMLRAQEHEHGEIAAVESALMEVVCKARTRVHRLVRKSEQVYDAKQGAQREIRSTAVV